MASDETPMPADKGAWRDEERPPPAPARSGPARSGPVVSPDDGGSPRVCGAPISTSLARSTTAPQHQQAEHGPERHVDHSHPAIVPRSAITTPQVTTPIEFSAPTSAVSPEPPDASGGRCPPPTAGLSCPSGRRHVASGLLARGPRLGCSGSEFIPADVGARYLVGDPFDLRLGEHLP